MIKKLLLATSLISTVSFFGIQAMDAGAGSMHAGSTQPVAAFWTPLINKKYLKFRALCLDADLAAVKELIAEVRQELDDAQLRAFLNRPSTSGNTALHIIARDRKSHGLYEFLWRHGADDRVKNEEKKTPRELFEERGGRAPMSFEDVADGFAVALNDNDVEFAEFLVELRREVTEENYFERFVQHFDCEIKKFKDSTVNQALSCYWENNVASNYRAAGRHDRLAAIEEILIENGFSKVDDYRSALTTSRPGLNWKRWLGGSAALLGIGFLINHYWNSTRTSEQSKTSRIK